jgi:hypothetical protein
MRTVVSFFCWYPVTDILAFMYINFHIELNILIMEFISCGFSMKDEEYYFPSLYWIPNAHNFRYRIRYIAGTAKCSTKPFSKLLTLKQVSRGK